MRIPLFFCLITCLVVSLGGASPRENFATFQRVTASVENGNHIADYAVDGRANNFHSWRTGNNPGPHWLELTYPREVTLGSAHVHSGILNATVSQIWQDFRFQYHDGSDWIDIAGSAVNGNDSPEVNILFDAPATSDRFRLITNRSGSHTLRELALFPPNLDDHENEQGRALGTDVIFNVAYKRPANSSSANLANMYGPGYARNAFDGYLDNMSRWLSSANEAGEWLEVDLIDNHTIGSAHVYSGFIGPDTLPRQSIEPIEHFKLQYLSGDDWLDIPGTHIEDNTEVALVVPFDAPITTQRVRLVTTSPFNARIQQLQLFHPREAGYEIGREVIDAPPPRDSWERFGDSLYILRCDPAEGTDRRLAFDGDTVLFADGGVGDAALRWQLLYNFRNDTWRIRHFDTGRCLALQTIAKTPGNLVVAETYSGLPHQEWIVEAVSGKPDHFRLINAYCGHALQTSSNWEIGTPMSVAPVDQGSAAQHWRTTSSVKHFPKKGIAAADNVPNPSLPDPTATWMSHAYPLIRDASWSYGWGRQFSRDFPYMDPLHTFNPTQWGNFNFLNTNQQGAIDKMRTDLQSNGRPVFLIGFNEPDSFNQAGRSLDPTNPQTAQDFDMQRAVNEAVRRWPRLEALDVPLVSPSPANALNNSWMDSFFSQTDARGYRVEHVAIHIYIGPNVNNFINRINEAYDRWGRPVWVKEFSVVRWSGGAQWTHAANYNFLAELLWRAESVPHLARYSLFKFRASDGSVNQSAPDPPEAPRSNAYNVDGTLTPFGKLYATWDGVTEVRKHRAYHLHNRSRYRRAANPEDADTIASVGLEDGAANDQFFLIPGTTENTLRICSTVDGRRIRNHNFDDVGFAAADNTTTQSEWILTPVTSGANHDGWYFIEHPETGTRLRMNEAGNVVDGSGVGTGDDFRWRFVIPMDPQPVSPPPAPAPPSTQSSLDSITLSWDVIEGANTYYIRRATSAEGPWTLVASNLTATTWTDEGLSEDSTWLYQLVASNNMGASPPSAPASASTLHTFSTYESWAAELLAHLPEADQQPTANPSGDGLPNLLKFVFLSDPTVGTGSQFRVESTSSDSIKLRFPWNARSHAHTWRIRHSDDLSDTESWEILDPPVYTTEPDGDIDWIRVTVPTSSSARRFYILEVQ